ncbi:interferon-induced GTP-binding protein Mx [Colletotrichum salicis]|uniref:Interferon-induced GTP-binding protein Mx n=1 Tax=Colletotrichum salicis TaxID=1209931 RepID=A0A135UGM8_9PEZI|nr:interferon-induced GTP-binding protein Mx [Colletotrichum salicis]
MALVTTGITEDGFQSVSAVARKLDPIGGRTLGILIDPLDAAEDTGSPTGDSLSKDQESELLTKAMKMYARLPCGFGWHAQIRTESLRELIEPRSLSRTSTAYIWSPEDPDHREGSPLDWRLGGIFSKLTRLQLSGLISDLEDRVTDLDACYDHEFFHKEEKTNDKKFRKRLRAVVQNIIVEFEEQMHREGHTHAIMDTAVDDRKGPNPIREVYPRHTYAKHVRNLMDQSKGRQTPGGVISELMSNVNIGIGFWTASHVVSSRLFGAPRRV